MRKIIVGNALIDRARNKALASVREDAEWVLMVDDDMTPPKEAITRLIDHNIPVVSALCTTRIPPIRLVMKFYDASADCWRPPTSAPPAQKVLQGPIGTGAAFLLLRYDAIQALTEYYLSAKDWMDEKRKELDRLHVRSEWRDKEQKRKSEIRRERYAKEKFLRIFSTDVGDDELDRGEDITLSRKLHFLGIPVGVDTGLQVGHLGERVYTPDDVDWERENDNLTDRILSQ